MKFEGEMSGAIQSALTKPHCIESSPDTAEKNCEAGQACPMVRRCSYEWIWLAQTRRKETRENSGDLPQNRRGGGTKHGLLWKNSWHH